MCHRIVSFATILIIVTFVDKGDGWRAVPANQARYALRDPTYLAYEYGTDRLTKYLHSVYKFGYCIRTSISSRFLRKSVNMTFQTINESIARYVYLLAGGQTYARNQCLVMRIYTPWRFIFFMSRFPMYYCQGVVNLLVFGGVHQVGIHEFYVGVVFQMPAHITFSFYQPPIGE